MSNIRGGGSGPFVANSDRPCPLRKPYWASELRGKVARRPRNICSAGTPAETPHCADGSLANRSAASYRGKRSSTEYLAPSLSVRLATSVTSVAVHAASNSIPVKGRRSAPLRARAKVRCPRNGLSR